MTTTPHTLAILIDWIVSWLGLDLASESVVVSLDEQEVSEQLQHGRD